MATWQAIVDGTTYNLSDGSPFKVISVSGIGNAPVRRLEERGPFQDGVTDVGYRFDPRLINMVIGVHSSSLSNADTNRDTLSGIFNPVGGRTIYLRCTRDDSAVRQIDCYAVNMVDMPAEMPERMLAFQRVGVQLKAPNPMWYDPTAQSIAFATSAPQWVTGGGAINSANVLTWAENPTVGQVGTIGTPSTWTILTRTAMPSSGTQALWSIPGTAAHMRIGTTSFGTITVEGGRSIGAYTGVAGTLYYWILCEGSYDDFAFFPHGYSYFSSAAGGKLPGNTIRWRDNGSGVENWSGSVTHAAVWNTPLSATQRNAVVNAASDTSAVLLGTATYAGSRDEYPVITLTGPIDDPVVTNSATGETLDFTGSTISAGDAWQIDTRYGRKTVLNAAGSSIIAYLTNDSDLATFHLTPGPNAISVAYTGGTTTASSVSVSYYNRYVGL